MSHEKKNKEGYSSLQDFIQAEILQHCQCGRPEDSLEFIKKLLNHLNKRIHPDQYGTYEKYSDSFAAWGKELNSFFYNDSGLKFTVLYMLDRYGLTEHGGSVPGWLDTAGENLLSELNKIEDFEQPFPI